MKTNYVIFDLDDTLIYEIDFLKSAYKEISEFLNDDEVYEIMIEKYFLGENVFEFLEKKYLVKKEELLHIYRNHIPTIELIDGAKELLQNLVNKNCRLGLITDGRSITQRNKIKALQIESFFDKIVISEEIGTTKPNMDNYTIFSHSNAQFYYIGDNITKDFVTPNHLGWTTICLLDNGKNIHKQNFELDNKFLPKFKIKNLLEINTIIY